jgi:hypothetical protein
MFVTVIDTIYRRIPKTIGTIIENSIVLKLLIKYVWYPTATTLSGNSVNISELFNRLLIPLTYCNYKYGARIGGILST